MVLFYASWCGHCHNLIPDYIKFADKAQFLHVYAIEHDSNKSFYDKLKDTPLTIEGFPTIYLFKDGKPVEEYNGERNVQSLMSKSMLFCNTECKCDTNL